MSWRRWRESLLERKVNTIYYCGIILASVPGLPRSVHVLIICVGGKLFTSST